jgi:carbonyl reductase 1
MQKVAVVSGANQGLGLALVEALCRALGPSAAVYLTARDPARGEAAAGQLRQHGLVPIFHRLDVTDEGSVQALAQQLQARHGGVDIVISNAAARISRERSQAEQVRVFIDTNNHGTYRMIRSFGPILRDGGRFTVVASGFGSLRNLAPQLHQRFDVATRTLEDIERAMDDYVSLVESGQAQAQGWPEWINVPSKVAQVASMKIMARLMEPQASQRGISITALVRRHVEGTESGAGRRGCDLACCARTDGRDSLWRACPASQGDRLALNRRCAGARSPSRQQPARAWRL